MEALKAIVRVVNAVLNTINRVNKKRAADDAANTVANGGRVRKSDKSFDELADESERDSAK